MEVARSYLRVHVRHAWTGQCQACGDRYPCKDRRDARLVVGGTEPLTGPPGRRIALLAVPVLAGLVLIALASVGLVP
ncbi:MAG TPA: hypothetical protein VHJ83_03480 [Micromonosporaceae bacterium]|nr:hypothetical protein [Micromonosporaceae bacterium]